MTRILALLLVLPLAACGGDPDPTESSPGADEAANFEPVDEEPASDEPASDEPASDEPASDEPASDEPASDASALQALHANIAETAARAEHGADRVTVEHVLISFAGRGTAATRAKTDAEAMTAQLLARIDVGDDFSAIRAEHSDDTGGGIYIMLAPEQTAQRGTYARTGMVAAFGDVGWRLEVGEVGVAPFDLGPGPSGRPKSPYGWHIIKRVK